MSIFSEFLASASNTIVNITRNILILLVAITTGSNLQTQTPISAQSLPSPTPQQSTIPSQATSLSLFTPSPTPFSGSVSKPPNQKKSIPTTQPANPQNYKLEPDPEGKEGFYVMKYAPSETMASVEELNQAINSYRQAHNLNTIYIDPQLCEIATRRALEIAKDFSHDKFGEHVSNGDYDYTGFNQIGENLWQGEFSAVHIVEFGWDQSPGHRANLQGNWSRGCAGVNGVNAVFIFAN